MVFNRQFENNSSRNFEKCNSDTGKLSSCDKTLKPIRNYKINKLIFAHLNTDFKKFELLKQQIKGCIDILMISETKIDDTFPHRQFLIEGFITPYRLDGASNGGGILLYVREDIFIATT